VKSEKKNILIITGAAGCVREDIEAVFRLVFSPLAALGDNSSYASNHAALDLSVVSLMAIGLDAVDKYLWNVKYFATYHPSEIEMAKERRASAGGNTDYMVISHQQHAENITGRDLVDLIIPCEQPSGSSALLGVLAGIQLGYKKIIVCGCPLQGKNDKGYDYANFQTGWTAKLSEIKDKTRSMSGWTKELLGSPDTIWLASE
jgi:hypothetical protein